MGDALPLVDLGRAAEVDSVSCGFAHSRVLLRDRRVKCWGANEYGQLGLGDEDRGDEPGEMGDTLPAVDLGRDDVAISSSGVHNCALFESGAARCWGLSEWDGSDTSAPGRSTSATPCHSSSYELDALIRTRRQAQRDGSKGMSYVTCPERAVLGSVRGSTPRLCPRVTVGCAGGRMQHLAGGCPGGPLDALVPAPAVPRASTSARGRRDSTDELAVGCLASHRNHMSPVRGDPALSSQR
ncbi:hypothetical protein [Nannocystis sp. SCPEA4]|uniref:hypothetical protein n=1 Tax=Nannocystis sp. SCPEA4 TaxID=2996787 RepID=UPI002270562A|nr:hypothetical protein [Nannocystis sp. SCPEA4]MCY1060942.1 hypothetical protein [Nannocystis sp. SCPEA4]